MREPLHTLVSLESFSRFQLQDKHNASYFFIQKHNAAKEPWQIYYFFEKVSKFARKMLFLQAEKGSKNG